MAQETKHKVLLVLRNRNSVYGFCVYPEGQLPSVGDVITVIDTLGTPAEHRAHVTQVDPESDFPISANEVEPGPQ